MTTDNALDYVGKIVAAYNAAEKAGASALAHALECGEHLNAAMKTVTAAKGGKWKTWREKNLPTVSEETERLYRRLADAVAQQEDFFAKCKSIRDAMKHLAKYEIKDGILVLKPEKTPRQPPANGNSVTGLQPPETDSPSTGLEAELENAAADEIISSIEDDVDKLEDVAQAVVARLTPDKLCDALIRDWPPDQLRDLVKQVNAYLSTLTGSSNYRRPAAQPLPENKLS